MPKIVSLNNNGARVTLTDAEVEVARVTGTDLVALARFKHARAQAPDPTSRFVSDLPTEKPATKPAPGKPASPAPADDELSELTPEELQVCRATGVSPRELAQHKKKKAAELPRARAATRPPSGVDALLRGHAPRFIAARGATLRAGVESCTHLSAGGSEGRMRCLRCGVLVGVVAW